MSRKETRAVLDWFAAIEEAELQDEFLKIIKLDQIRERRAERKAAEEREIAKRKANIRTQLAEFWRQTPNFEGTDAELAAALGVSENEVHYSRFLRTLSHHRRLLLTAVKAAE